MHLRHRVAPLFVSLLASLSLTGCLSPFLRHAPGIPEPRPAEVLVAGMNVRFESTQDKGLLEATLDVAQNAQLENFGQHATQLLESVLAEQGYHGVYDRARSAQLDFIQLQSTAQAAALTGVWRHPDSSHHGPSSVDNLFVQPATVISRLRAQGRKEFFAFSEIVIRDKGFFLKEPWVVVHTTIYDQDARKVLDLQGIGEGNSRFLFADRSSENLQLALERGFASVKAVEPKDLP